MFRIIDAIALQFQCQFTYIPENVHQYIIDNQHKIFSRSIDVLTERKTFYQRAWPGSTLVQQSLMDDVIRRKEEIDTLFPVIQKVNRQRQQWDGLLLPKIRQQAQRVRTDIVDRAPNAVQQWQTLLSKIRSFPPRTWQLYRNFVDEYDIVVKFYDT